MTVRAGAAILFSLLALAVSARAQEPDDTQPAAADGANALGAPTIVHGIVKNALTGEPLPRALVLVNGQAGIGALTDGDGRFEFSGVSLGPNTFQITKPGFEDAAGVPSSDLMRDLLGFTHNVLVTNNTPPLVFSLRPTNTVGGHIELSTGDPAQNNSVTLLRRGIVNGRAVWRPNANARANADGSYHFAHLPDGDYAVLADPAPESDMVSRPAFADAERDVASNWYPQLYYPDAHDFAGAARIHVAGGEQAQANFTLPLEPFHPVRAAVLLPADLRNGDTPPPVQVEIAAPDGHHLPYPGMYDAKSNTVEALLPDGNYSLRVSAMNANQGIGAIALSIANERHRMPTPLTGQLDLTVAGHALTKLGVSLGPQATAPLEIDLNRTSTPSASQSPRNGQVFVEITQAGSLTDGMQSMFAQGTGPGSIDTVAPAPGRYWVHTIVADPTLCESSFTAGGANLGREPLVVGQGGSTAPLTLTLRDDCASLKVSLPPSLAGLEVGEEAAYTVYIVPDFDFTTEAPSRTLRATSGSTLTFTGLTPGSYHVYTFGGPVDLEYHNRDALAAYPGQAVTLAPGAAQELVLEVPAQ
jgi:hypothetical protein